MNAREIVKMVGRMKFSAGAKMRKRMLGEVLKAHEETKTGKWAEGPPTVWRIVMESKVTTLTAVILLVGGIFAWFMTAGAPRPAYAELLGETVEALESVQHIHTVMRDDAGNVVVERWIEIGPSGYQAKYWQDSAGILIADDGETCSVYNKDKNTVVLYDSDQNRYQWFGNLRELLRDLAGKGKRGAVEIELDASYWGRAAHRVKLVRSDTTCYVDPETKLPFAIGPDELSYEQPPAGTFAFSPPASVAVVDRRVGAREQKEPDWMKKDEAANEQFSQARKLLSNGDYIGAIELFKQVVEVQPRRNRAWYWMGRAHYELGQYDEALYEYSKVIDMFRLFHKPFHCYFARGLAYAAKGMEKAAVEDLLTVLPVMIKGLRSEDTARMFDLSDDPIHWLRSDREKDLIRQASCGNMVRRLRKITGQDFGGDLAGTSEVREEVIAAWEKWFRESPQIEVDRSYELEFIVPEVPAAEKQFMEKLLSLRGEANAQQALGLLDEAKQLDPADNAIWSSLAFCLYDTGCYSEALEAFGRATELEEEQDPEHIYGTLTWQGHVLDLLGRRDEAVQCYKEALTRYTGFYVQYARYNVTVDKKWIKERLREPFQQE